MQASEKDSRAARVKLSKLDRYAICQPDSQTAMQITSHSGIQQHPGGGQAARLQGWKYRQRKTGQGEAGQEEEGRHRIGQGRAE